MSRITFEEYKIFLRNFVYPHECAYEKGFYGNLNHVIVENVPGDSGSYTKWGVDYTSHKSLGVNGIKNLTIDQADNIYWKEFSTNGSAVLDSPLCYVYDDCAINAGSGRAKQFLSITKDPSKCLDERAAWYKRLVAANPKNQKFLKGWLARVEDLRKYLKLK